MPWALILAATAAQNAGTAEMLAEYRERVRAERPCPAAQSDNEIVVCLAREADSYRVPLRIGPATAETSVHAQTAERLERVEYSCGISGPFMVGCGMVGMTATMGADGKTRVQPREPAP